MTRRLIRFLPPSHLRKRIKKLALEYNLMKTMLALFMLFSLTALPALGELTLEDIEKIDTKIKESEARTQAHINTQIESVDKRLSLVTTLIEKIDTKIKESEARTQAHINTQIESVDKRLSLVTTLIVGLIALIVLAIGIPQILMALRSRRDESLEKQV